MKRKIQLEKKERKKEVKQKTKLDKKGYNMVCPPGSCPSRTVGLGQACLVKLLVSTRRLYKATCLSECEIKYWPSLL